MMNKRDSIKTLFDKLKVDHREETGPAPNEPNVSGAERTEARARTNSTRRAPNEASRAERTQPFVAAAAPNEPNAPRAERTEARAKRTRWQPGQKKIVRAEHAPGRRRTNPMRRTNHGVPLLAPSPARQHGVSASRTLRLRDLHRHRLLSGPQAAALARRSELCANVVVLQAESRAQGACNPLIPGHSRPPRTRPSPGMLMGRSCAAEDPDIVAGEDEHGTVERSVRESRWPGRRASILSAMRARRAGPDGALPRMWRLVASPGLLRDLRAILARATGGVLPQARGRTGSRGRRARSASLSTKPRRSGSRWARSPTPHRPS